MNMLMKVRNHKMYKKKEKERQWLKR